MFMLMCDSFYGAPVSCRYVFAPLATGQCQACFHLYGWVGVSALKVRNRLPLSNPSAYLAELPLLLSGLCTWSCDHGWALFSYVGISTHLNTVVLKCRLHQHVRTGTDDTRDLLANVSAEVELIEMRRTVGCPGCQPNQPPLPCSSPYL